MTDHHRRHPASITELFQFDPDAETLPSSETFDPMMADKLLRAIDQLGARWRGRHGAEHTYTNSLGQKTDPNGEKK